MNFEPLRLAVLISGGGRTLRNFIDRAADGRLNVEIALVLSSSRSAGGLKIAEQAGIETLVVEPSDCPSANEFRDAIFKPCRKAGVQLVAMAGFIKHVLIPGYFENRVVNIHPALIPSFCGKGFYGERVHKAVLEAGATTSGCTVHFVDDQYDHGPILLQRSVPVLADDTPTTLAARVFGAECEAYPEAINLIASGRVHVDESKVLIR